VVDTALVGRSGTAIDLGGSALGVTITGFILWAFSFLRMGTAGFAAQAFGARDDGEQRSTFLRALALALIFGFALLLLMVPLGMLAFAIFNTGSDTLDIAGRYYHIRMFAAPFDLVLYVVIGWLLGRQRIRECREQLVKRRALPGDDDHVGGIRRNAGVHGRRPH
jgi:MATE family multidrug resistance protein